MLRTDFHFELPKELIALRPTQERSASRLLTLDGLTGAFEDRQFHDFPLLLDARDLLVFNDTRVIPARTFGVKDSGGRVELLLERRLTADTAQVHVRASKGLKIGTPVRLAAGESATLIGRDGELFVLRFSCDVLGFFLAHGQIPLPPYIDRMAEDADRERYQTVYARSLGAVAAPTAGLHFDRAMFAALHARGVQHAFVTLHVGAGTFAPVRSADIELHEMHSEYLEVPQSTCDAIERARAGGGRVVAVGTTVVRSLEAAAEHAPGAAQLAPFKGNTRIFIKPGFVFRAVDAMVTNFHLPESTLLMLCSAFAGREALLAAYAHAVRARYRFFSYGDAMFLTPSAAARIAP
ncbi:MAG TPA: tRNA preQ1(34) S-adenosylmethionine ribosyltransferase-isomerase QueA [Steroidobacteraceae bacterium]|jgi:S-adenosylmethionine:tRNA ribosyltransferase-isomerase|nr:tRNA preQ1(34) S-adenosylmethionine ribosyltransferase-isomerase QueA [Steroidobacteraceae bacterium]